MESTPAELEPRIVLMRKFVRTCCAVSIVIFLFWSIGFAGVVSPELELILNGAAPSEKIPIIITLADKVDISAYASQDQFQRRPALVSALRSLATLKLRPLKAFLRNNTAQRVRELWLINGMAATLPASTVQLLQSLPGIASVRSDEVIQLPQVMAAGGAPVEWNINAVNASALWSLGLNGTGIVVANMDSGVDINHADLIDRYRGGSNSWYDPNGEHPTIPTDNTGHGTGTMAIMVGGDATGSAIGMAPGAQWIAAKIFNDAGQASTSVIHQAFQWMLDPDSDPNTADSPHVVNNSWGYPDLLDLCYLEFQYDIQALEAAGIAVVFSAGNGGPNPSTSISPANNPESFAVGSVSDTLAIAYGSSRGPSACVLVNDLYPEVVAPGVSVKTADLTSNGLFPTLAAYVSGTSFAASHVSGALALLKQAFPGLAPSELETALMQTAQDLGDAGPDDTYGYGLIDVLAAYQSLVPCTDSDGDGFFVESACAIELDCNDQDAAIYPGATEVKHDSIDQDCNGYDLSIDIISAIYRSDTDVLEVIATSTLGQGAGLQLDAFGPMAFNSASNQWELLVPAAGGNPSVVIVSGLEGSESVAIVECTNTCQADFNDDSFVNFGDLALLRSNFGADCHLNPPEELCIGDANDDLFVNYGDLAKLRQEFGRSDCMVCQ